MLLTGARGTGKSSLIKACLNEFAAQGLRLIEVDKADLVDLPDLVDLVAERPESFIVFCDDLSFEEGEPGYKALKSVLDGSVAQSSDNVLIYATSNRRHLLPEYMKENLTYIHTEDGEVHPGEVVEEKTSLSERFGLWVSFYPFSQDEYLAIIAQWLRHFGADEAAIAAARQDSLVWALERGSRSGRVAYQFARDTLAAPRAGRTGRDGDRPREAADAGVDVAVGVLIDADGALPAHLAPRRQGLRRLLGVPRRQGRARRNGRSRRCAANCTRRSASPSVRSAVEDRAGRLSACAVRLNFCKVLAWSGECRCARARRLPGRACRWRCGRCCPAPCRCCAGSPTERGFAGATHLE